MFDSPGPAPHEGRESSALERLVTGMLRARSTEIGRVDHSDTDVALELPLVRDDDPRATERWEEAAAFDQDRLASLDRRFRLADSERTAALLTAYETSMQDLHGRYGAVLATRSSKGAQAFFASTGLVLGLSPLRVAHLVDTAQTLRDRLPRLWAVYIDGDATWRAVDLAVTEADGLDARHWPAYDEQAADVVVRSAASRLRAKLVRIRERLQDDTAGPRAKEAEKRRSVVIEPGRDGQASLHASGPAIPIVGFDQALTKAAVAARLRPDEARTVGQLRFDILMDLLVEGIKQSADPAWKGLSVPHRAGVVPAPIITIPALSALGRTKEQAHLAGYGPIAVQTAMQLAGRATTFVRVLTDPITGARIDMDRTKRVAPADMRRWVVLRDELCRFPGCSRAAQLCDLDHIAEWQDAGVTSAANLVSACRSHHAAKSSELWQEELRHNGRVDWEDPWGRVFEDPPPTVSDPAPPDLVEPSPTPLDEPACPF